MNQFRCYSKKQYINFQKKKETQQWKNPCDHHSLSYGNFSQHLRN